MCNKLGFDEGFDNLDLLLAKKIIYEVGGTGQPPLNGYKYFTAGIDNYLKTIEREYLEDFIKCGGSSFKMVVGTYGGGKTHFLYNVLGKAWDYNYITSYIELNSNSTPFYKLEEVYKSIILNTVYPQEIKSHLNEYDRGIESILKIWYYETIDSLPPNSEDKIEEAVYDLISSIGPFESTSFQNAIKHSLLSICNQDEESFNVVIQWLKGENPSKSQLKQFNIYEKIDRSTAFKMIRCFVQLVLEIGYSGLIILLDEAEQKPSMGTKQKSTLLQNLRELIDACSRGILKGTMIFYAVPDEYFLEGRTGVYEALNQRLSTVFEGELNPTGVKIDLENMSESPVELMLEIGRSLARIYEIAYDTKFEESVLEETISSVAEKTYSEKFGEIGFKRLFVQQIIKTFHSLNIEKNT